MVASTEGTSPASTRSSKYMTMVAKAALTAGRRWPSCQSMRGDALSRRNKRSIKSCTLVMSTAIVSSTLSDAGFGPMPICFGLMTIGGHPPSTTDPGMQPARV
eukprot:1804022-Prymnesium_polylepis.1